MVRLRPRGRGRGQGVWVAIKKEGDRVEDGGWGRWGDQEGGSCFRRPLKDSISRLLGSRVGVRLRLE